jgi:hypothetical protein
MAARYTMTTSWSGAVSRLALRTPACAVDAAASLDGATHGLTAN